MYTYQVYVYLQFRRHTGDILENAGVADANLYEYRSRIIHKSRKVRTREALQRLIREVEHVYAQSDYFTLSVCQTKVTKDYCDIGDYQMVFAKDFD
jgi:hypothetical protein